MTDEDVMVILLAIVMGGILWLLLAQIFVVI